MKIKSFVVAICFGTVLTGNVFASFVEKTCRGENDNLNRVFYVSSATDYILSNNIFSARNIKNGRFDDYCGYLADRNLWDQVSSASTATVQDLINYQCSKESYICSSDIEGFLRQGYQKNYDVVTNPDARKLYPTKN